MDDMIFSFKVETPPAWIPIGRTAENDWRTIEIDCSYWFNIDASGNVVLMYRPNCGMAPYPLLIERDGDNIVWHPKSGELVEGVGQMQAFFYVGESKIGSSEMVSCEVDGSLLGGGTGTDPGAVAPPWAIDIIEQIAVLSGHYPKIENGVLYVWDSEQEDWVQFQGGGGNPNAVLYTPQTLTPAQQAQARENIGAGTYSKPSGGIPDSDIASAATWNAKGTYSKPSGGIPASDLAVGVIPTVPQMATDPDMADWDTGKTVDAAVLKNGVQYIERTIEGKADASDIPTAVSELTNDSGFVTAQQAAASAPVQSVNGRRGEVVLDAEDVGALPDDTVIPSQIGQLSDNVGLVHYNSQTLTDVQKAQARTNVGAGTYSKPASGIPASDLAQAVQDALDATSSGLTEDVKQALLDCFAHVAWIDADGQDYYDALETALYPPANLVSISAVFTQGSAVIYDADSLDTLKQYLVVTATYDDQSTRTVTDYTLSGTLAEGTSTITVAYGGKTTTFTCTVQSSPTSDMDGWADGVAYTNLTIVPNSYSRKRDGEFISYEGWDRTDFVPCNGAATIVFPPMPILANENPESNNFYDENHARVSNFNLSKTLTVTITVPQTAYYFVISGETGVLQGCIRNGIVPHGE